MPKTFSRSDWRARPANGGPGPLYGSNVVGIALHWPAMTKPIRGVENVMAAIRSWQAFHMSTRGWSDIAYQVAVDQDGNRYILRGLDTQSGANGNEDLNERFGAVLLILAPGEQPTPAMMKAVRSVVADHRGLFRHSTQVVGHGQIRPGGSECPGPIVQGLIDAGAFEPPPVRAPIRRALRVATSAIKEIRDLGYPGFADRLKAAREKARKNHSR